MKQQRITRHDLETKLAELKDDNNDDIHAMVPAGVSAAVAAVTGLVGLAYFLGGRKQKKLSTIVEVRRV